jgi:glycosyltransferase involved in cell wall biosynthesis
MNTFTGSLIMSCSETKAAHRECFAEQEATAGKHPQAIAMPLVSVVIACYNSARYLAETLTSVMTQTYPRIEIIVVDDGSSDATASIAQSYPVTYLHQENQGVSVARNAGILHCQGKYVQFLDHDDRLLPKAIETGVRLLEQHPEFSMAVGEHRYIGVDGTTLGYSSKRAVGCNHYLALLMNNFIETPCSVVHRRSALPITGVFDESVQGAEDYELYLRIARQSELILHEAVVAEYRLHDGSLSRDAEQMILVTHRVLQMELPYLRGNRKKLRQLDRGRLFVRRHFGRRLTRELMGSGRLTIPEAQRKLKLLRRYYPLGFVAVALSRLLPAWLLNQSSPSCP